MSGSNEYCVWVCFNTIKGSIYLNIVYYRKQKRLELREDFPVSPREGDVELGEEGPPCQGNTGLSPRLC